MRNVLIIAICFLGYVRSSEAIPAKDVPGTNLTKEKGGFERLEDWRGSWVRMALSSENVHEGQYCMGAKTVANERNVNYFYLQEQFLPFVFRPGRTYTITVWVRTEREAQARVCLEEYDQDKKWLGSKMSAFSGKSPEWKQLKISYTPPRDGSVAKLLLWVYGSGTVYFDDLDVRFTSHPPRFYFRKTDDGLLSIHGEYPSATSTDSELSVEICLKDPLNGKVLSSNAYQLRDKKLSADIDLSKYDVGICRFEILIRNLDKTVYSTKMTYVPGIDCAYKEMKSHYKLVNSEVGVNVKEANEVNADTEEQKRGLILFNRPEPRWVQPDSLPLPEERVVALKRVAAPGDSVFFTLAILPLGDMSDVRLVLEGDTPGKDLTTIQGLELGHLRYWAQQTLYAYWDGVPTYWIVPELIDPMKAHNVRSGRVEQYSLRVPVPSDAQGKYSGRWVIKAGQRVVAAVDVMVDVLPVQLSQPSEVVFGLYVDPIRWCSDKDWYSDDHILDELKMVRKHGFNSLVLGAAPPMVPVSYGDGKYTWDMSELERALRLCVEAGFTDQPYILDPYALERVLESVTGLPKPKGRVYTKEYGELIDQVFEQIRRMTVEGGFPEPIIYGVDEASHGERLDRSIRILNAARKHGFRTCATTYPYVIDSFPEFDAALDFRIYSMPGFWSIRNQQDAEETREASAAAGDVFWYYGAGCYANANPPGPQFRIVRQEGGLTENRYMHGLLMYRMGAKGSWAWTFSRTRNDPENDFDGGDKVEPKDQCIVYPGPNGYGVRTTLQWEALRQGWQDYRAVSTLDRLLAKRGDEEGEMIKVEMDKRIAEIPWQNYTQYPNEKLDKLREWLLERICELER